MAATRYRRDWFGHFATPPETNRPCEHACCRGMRPHPQNWPVILPSRQLRAATDEQLAEHYSRHGGDTPADEASRAQVLYEMQRRDLANERREATEERRRQRWTARRHERQEAVEQAWLAAEAGTKGNMLNQRGKEARINERTLFTGPEARARKYASEELLNWWEDHPRPTGAYFEGQDTRVGYGTRPRRNMSSEEQAWRDRYDEAGRDFEGQAA